MSYLCDYCKKEILKEDDMKRHDATFDNILHTFHFHIKCGKIVSKKILKILKGDDKGGNV